MQAIILAAGMGKRLKELTKNNTKCMVKVNGVTLIERMLRQISKHRISRIIIVVGYKSKILIDYISTLNIKIPIIYIENKIYDKTNNIYSLSLAKKYLCEDDTLLFESDLIFEDSALDALINDSRKTLTLVDKYENWMDGTCVTINEDDSIKQFIPSKKYKFEDKDKYYKTVNIYKFSKEFSKNEYIPFLDAYRKATGNNEYYEQVLKIITILDDPKIQVKRLNGELWYEIDDIQDLDIASSIFANENKYALMQSRFGGYWRYPKMLDFSYLVNPYFPPQRLMDEIKANFENLLTQYPSGQRINSLLAAKNFNIKIENIAIGNGASELIKSIMQNIKGKIGIIRPTFDEYPNRYSETVEFRPNTDDFSYTADDVINFFDDKNIKAIVLINPDNPTGNYIKKQDLLKLNEWTKRKKIIFILDESFVDFSDEKNATLIEQTFIEKNKHLIIIKSISKSYGVPGLRLGILVCGDSKIIDNIKKDIAIWNINSFGEFYMQIAEKYTKDYEVALETFRTERARFKSELEKIPNFKVFNSQANYFMIEILNVNIEDFLCSLLYDYGILVKDSSGKFSGKRKFIRIAIKNTADNNKFIKSTQEYIQKQNLLKRKIAK